ncbi:hypothetical protein H0A71_20470 [Alcaligenaceae bacterium]|nr:hypothetical protein [Alcaligenaceae bacterium]
MADTPCDYDSPWKEALAQYFDGFIALFVPTLHAVIDWSHPPVFLDKEFQASSGRGKSGRRYVDALAAIQTNGTSPVSVFGSR